MHAIKFELNIFPEALDTETALSLFKSACPCAQIPMRLFCTVLAVDPL